MSTHILLVDDDTLFRRGVTFSLEQSGYRVNAAASAEDGLELARRERPDIVLLDIGLPGMDGLDALRYFQAQVGVPVIFLTARRRELDEVLGLKLGAEDYITKPFDMDVLITRIEVVLRRLERPSSPGAEPEPLAVGDMRIDPAAHTISIGDRLVELPPREFDLLHVLALEAGHVVSTDDLLARVWGPEYAGEPQVIYVHVRWLRQKIEEDPQNPRRITTVRGVGYKLEPQEA